MSQKKNFIATTDKETAETLIAEGLELVSHVGNTYTFLNQLPKNFIFNEDDKKKMCYTNTLLV